MNNNLEFLIILSGGGCVFFLLILSVLYFCKIRENKVKYYDVYQLI